MVVAKPGPTSAPHPESPPQRPAPSPPPGSPSRSCADAMRQHTGQQQTKAVPVQKPSEGQQPGATADFLVGETDFDGFGGCFESNELGHCLVAGIPGVIEWFTLHPSITSRQRPSWLLNRHGSACPTQRESENVPASIQRKNC